MSKLIAMVATAVLIDGQRTVIQPGQQLPALPEHDVQELKASGAAKDPAEVASADEAAAMTRVAAERHFEEERKRVQAANASTQPDDTAGTPGTPGTSAKAKAAAKRN
jgi:hypothetical protein